MDKVRIFSIDIKCYIFFISTFFMLSSSSSKQYRTDYVYNSETDAFYKFHMETAYYSQARTLCTAEGASLMVPSSEEDVAQAHGLFKQYPDIGDLAWIGNDGNRHDDDDDEEVPIINLDYLHTAIEGDRWRGNTWNECHIMKRTGEVQRIRCLNVLPFICKVDAKDMIYNKQCKVFGKGYRYFENVGSCYKIPEQGFQWNKAYAECRAEGAHLVVLNSELERQVMYNITNEERHIVYNARVSWFFFAGIRAKKETDGSPIVFKTIFNQTLEEAGFSQWSENEPNNSKGKEYCGAIFKNDGKYNDIDCADQLAFICEKEVLNTSS